MGHPLRLYEPNVVYEVTTNVIQGRRLLRPSPQVNELIAGILGRAQYIYPNLSLYGFSALSTHTTMLVSSPNPRDVPAFIAHVNGNISKEIGKLHNWSGRFWARRARSIPVVDEAAVVRRLEYLLSQGTKEGLVASPRHWPGISSVDALRGKQSLRGMWFDRDAETRAKRRGDDPGPCNSATAYTVQFSKIPGWHDLSDAEYAERIEVLIRKIEKDALDARGTKPVLGKRAVQMVDPHSRAEMRERTPAPTCHASCKANRLNYKKRYRWFVEAFREAATLLRLGVLDVEFPLWSFPPPRRFVHSTP